jgi:putative ATP-binding cassette transporter
MAVIWLLLKGSEWTVAIAILTGLISGGGSAQLIALINRALSQPTDRFIELFIGLALVVLVTNLISQFLLIKLSQQAVYQLRLQLSQRILSAPLQHLEALGAGRLLATLTEDVRALSDSVPLIPFLCIDITIVAGCLIYLSWLSVPVFGLTLLLLILAIASIQFLLNQARKMLILVREEDDRLFKHFRAITDGVKELKLHSLRQEAFFAEDLKPSAALSRQHNTAAFNRFSIATAWGQLVTFTILGLLLFGLPQLVTISPTVLSAYVLTLVYLMVPLQNLLQRLPPLLRANVALLKIERLELSLASQVEPRSPSHSTTCEWTTLELRQAKHTYRGEQEDRQFVLGEIDLKFASGQLIFIVGGNGSGKSTLAKIITGLYAPETGEIWFNDTRITDQNRDYYRQHFSAIFSDFYLFDRLLGLANPDLDQQAQIYLQQLQLDHKVRVEAGQLSTIALSQGQRKRLALLNAYLEDRPIYLFDEWASDQDPLFREIFYKHILMNLKRRGKTIFVISHDDRYFNLGDRLIKLDYGQVESDRVNPSH